MSITRRNYESYFLDYLEGSLDPSLREEMEVFLKRNPDLKEELEEFEQVALPVDPVQFEEKRQLKKTISAWNPLTDQSFDHHCIAKLEGELSADQEKSLDQMLRDQPDRKKELDLYLKTRLHPVPVLFPDKQSLKREETVFLQKRTWYTFSAAATIVLILGFSFLFSRLRNPKEEQFAIVTQAATSDESAVSESTTGMEKEISATEDQPVGKQMDPREVPGIKEGMDEVVSANPLLTMEKKENAISGTDQDLLANRTFHMEPLTRRESIQAAAFPEPVLASAENREQEYGNEAEYLTLREVVGSRLRRVVSPDEPAPTGQENKITFLDIADAGVRGISRITGADMKLDRYYDQEGELSYYAFTSKSLSFSREVKK